MSDIVQVDCETGAVTTRPLTADEQAERQAMRERAAQADETERLRTLAFQRDLAEMRALLPKLKRSSTDNLSQAEVRLIGRMVAWLWLREAIDS